MAAEMALDEGWKREQVKQFRKLAEGYFPMLENGS
jgi:hypothetical protein